MRKCLSDHAFIIVKMYVVNRIIRTWPPVVVMFTCCLILCRCVRNVWWFMVYKHPSKQCPACLSTNIVLAAGYATHVWNYIRSSCWKIHDPYKFEEAFNLLSKGVSCERISRILYILSGTLRTWKKRICVDLIALFHISNMLATFFIFVKMYACWTM